MVTVCGRSDHAVHDHVLLLLHLTRSEKDMHCCILIFDLWDSFNVRSYMTVIGIFLWRFGLPYSRLIQQPVIHNSKLIAKC